MNTNSNPQPKSKSKIHCGHCHEPGHNITKCHLFTIKLHIALHINDESILKPGRYAYEANHVHPNLFADIKLLCNSKITQAKYHTHLISYDNSLLEFSITELNNQLNNQPNKHVISCNSLRNEYTNDIIARLKHIRTNRLRDIKFSELYDIINNDYIVIIRNIKEARDAARARWQAEYNQRQRERAEQRARDFATDNAAHNAIVNTISALPILSTDAFHAEDCPICLEKLGDTNKAILRCGHPVCTSCLLTMTLRSANSNNATSCVCSVCRAPFL